VLLLVLVGGLAAIGGALTAEGRAGATITCNYYWTGHNSSEWTTKANWSTTNGGGASSTLPNSSSTVCMSTSPGTSSVAVTTTVTVGAIEFAATNTVTPQITISGELTVQSTSTPSTIAVVTDDGSYFEMYGPVSVGNFVGENGADIDGLASNAKLTLTGTSSVQSGSTLYIGYKGDLAVLNTGSFSIPSGASTYSYGSSAFENSGTITMGNDTNMTGEASASVTNDQVGTVHFTGGVNGAHIDTPITNDGTLSAANGTLDLSNNADLLGPDAVATTTGSGRVTLSGTAMPSTASPASIAGLTLSGGTLSSGDFVLPTGTTATIGDTNSGNGSLDAANLEVQSGATLSIPLDYTFYFYSASTLTNDGGVHFQTTNSTTSVVPLYDADNSGNDVVNNADGTILDTGTATGQIVTCGVPITNAGTIQVSGSGTINLDGAVTLDPTSQVVTPTSVIGGVTMPNGQGVVALTDTAQPNAGVNGSLDGFTINSGTLTGASGAGHFVVDPGSFFFVGCPTGGCNATSEANADVVNSGTIIVETDNTWYFTGSSTLENDGLISMTNSSYFYDEDTSVTNLLTNQSDGTITYKGTNDTETAGIEMALVNHGTINVPDGVLNVYLTIATLTTNGNLSQGTWNATGIINITDLYNATTLPTVLTNYATITLSTANGIYGDLQVDGTSVMTSLRTNDGSITSDVNTTAGNGITNNGMIEVQNGATLKTPSYTQNRKSPSVTIIDKGATLKAGSGAGAIAVKAGTLTGAGTLMGNVTNSGNGTVLAPAATGGAPLTITGSYATKAGSTTAVQIGGTSTPGVGYGQIAVSGAVSLAGNLTATIVNGFSPSAGTSVPVVTGHPVGGFFTSVSGTALSGGHAFSATYSSTAVNLVVASTVPKVTSVSPNKVAETASGFKVTITGTGFTSGATVKSSTSGVTFSSVTVSSSTKITAKVSVTANATTGLSNVLVSDPGQGTGACTGCLTIDHAPVITKLSPATGAHGKTSTVKVTGKYFASGIKAKFSGSGITVTITKVTSTTLTMTVKISSSAAKGSRSLTVTNSDGGVATKGSAFKVT
jgi:hypothetical protein